MLDMTQPIFESSKVGAAAATRVRITHGAFTGSRGVVVRIHHPGSIAVRFLDAGRRVTILPFGRSELEVV